MEIDKIYNEDSLETLRKMEDSSIDLIITSPPYNKGYWSRNRNMNNNTFNTKARRIEYDTFDDCMPPEEYEKWQRDILAECCRVIKPTGSIFYNHTDILREHSTIHPKYVYDFPVKQVIVWDRGNTPKIDKSYFFPITEWIFWIKKDIKAKPYFDRKNAEFQKCIWRINPERDNTHPAPFPIELPENIIKSCSKEGDIVYDPFMGSGTVALAAKNNNRHYIGSEISQIYVDMANKRIS